ncbi:MAG: Hsp20/alpha crystallin family protein [Altererythrobacter sp.]|uniref:Hsp20/alpha crystallin family protein n=1 Tax=Altererythrobacter sp. TaxID=1872480 RepID=UPI001B171E80|nr:Hsp20/alpha crystallin family protein [Altererythrobacter sp.]MBO6642784.1 Hsp20/alpha crystallin family protein [Altererythrobacter sp.]MBO6708708.1 Hsp20/alpha crystallin family protein [Altererythrobacter sp.]
MAKPPARRSFFDDLFNDFPFGYSIAPLHGDPLPAPGKIRLDVKENKDCLVIQAEVPGVKKEDIDVSVDNNVLTISAEVSQYDADEENDAVIHSERYYGSIRRSISLPAEVTADDATAKYEDGILVLKLPKSAKDSKRKISVG